MADIVSGGKVAEVSRQQFSVAYNGKTRAHDHSIDVEALAPALLAFGRLMREANQEFNGKNAKAKVLVISDFEHKCFNINFELALSIYEQIKSLLGDDGVKTAKEVLEWIGLLTPASGISYFGYLRWKNGRKITSATELIDQKRSGNVTVRVEGDNNPIVINNNIFNLSHNPRALKATRDAFTPIGQDGFENVEVRDADEIVKKIEPEDVQAIIASCNTGLEEIDEEIPDIEVTTAWLSVYSPVYDLAADKWRFKLGKDVVYVDISATEIGKNALERGGALADDAYQVRLEITTPRDKKGKAAKPSYRIVEVIKFIGADPTAQWSLFDKKIVDDQS